jgi:hypothetical protein
MINQNNKKTGNSNYLTALLLVLLGTSFMYLVYYIAEKYFDEPHTLSHLSKHKQSQPQENKGEKNSPESANTVQVIKEGKRNSQKNTIKELPKMQPEASRKDGKKEENIRTSAQVIADLEHEFRKKASSIIRTFKSTSNDREGRHIGEKNERFDIVTYHQFDFGNTLVTQYIVGNGKSEKKEHPFNASNVNNDGTGYVTIKVNVHGVKEIWFHEGGEILGDKRVLLWIYQFFNRHRDDQ